MPLIVGVFHATAAAAAASSRTPRGPKNNNDYNSSIKNCYKLIEKLAQAMPDKRY
jgi:hypothetical protein